MRYIIVIGTFIDFYICDINYFPFYRVRKVSTIQIPYKKNSLGEIITLIQTLLTVRNRIKKSLLHLETVLNLSNDVSDESTIHSDSDDETDDMSGTCTDDETFFTIKTQTTPKRRINK